MSKKSYAIDRTRFTPIASPSGKGRWYLDALSGEKVPRSQAIKLSQGASHSAIYAERTRAQALESSWREVSVQKALRKVYGPKRARELWPEVREELRAIWRKRPKVNKRKRLLADADYARAWREFNEEIETWSEAWSIYDDMDWSEFWADSPDEK